MLFWLVKGFLTLYNGHLPHTLVLSLCSAALTLFSLCMYSVFFISFCETILNINMKIMSHVTFKFEH